MSAREEQIIGESLAAFARGDVAGATASYHPDVVMTQAASLPHGGRHVGPAAVSTAITTLGATFDVTANGVELYSAGDRVVLRVDALFTSRATGRSAAVPDLEVYRFTDGLIVSIEVFYQDTKALADLLEPAVGA